MKALRHGSYDVTPDPFIGLFFACERARVTGTSAALVAIRVEDDQVARDLREPDPIEEFSVLETVREGAPKKGKPLLPVAATAPEQAH